MADTDQSLVSGRDNRGRFVSEGNIGRPVGARSKLNKQKLEYVKGMSDEALQKLREAVQKGERWAIELVLSKTLPASRTIEFEGMTVADIETAAANGDISPDEGRALSVMLRNLREISDIEQIHAKLIELEAIVQDGPRKQE